MGAATGATEPPSRARLRAWLEVPISTAPSVAADSETVLFASDEAGYAQPWAIPRTGGAPRRLLATTERITGVYADPRAPRAILATDSGGNEHWQLELLDLEGSARTARALTVAPKVIHQPGAWDGSDFYFTTNERDPRFFDIYRMGLGEGGTTERIRTEDAYLSVMDARDGHVLVERANTNLDIDLLLRRESGWVHLNPHAEEETVFSARLAPDAVFAAANPRREFSALLRYRLSGGAPEFLREYPGDVEEVRVAPDGRRILLNVNRGGFSETHFYDPATGEDRPLLSGPKGVIAGMSWCPDGAGFAFGLSHSEGVDIYYRGIETGKERRLTRAPHGLPARPVDATLGTFRTSDALPIGYWVYSPRPPATPKGTIVQVHGGPEAQARPGFSPLVQFLVEEGWRVVVPNVRGSTGYGRTFVHLDDVRKRMDSVRDLKELVGALEGRGLAEPGRIAVAGGSYGGFMVLAALTTYPDLFAAGIDIVGIANFLTFLEKTGPWRRKLREPEYGTLEHDADFLRSISPVFHAEKIRAPLLVIHGRNDPRVPFEEAEQIVATLRKLGRPVELLEYANEGHGMHRRDDQLASWSRAAAFLDAAIPRRAA
jgi:dipeptidyl aminopeptidase/acylaminoacyl peptidase